MTDELTKEEFVTRFVTRMVGTAKGDRFDDGELILDYAKATAPTYFENEWQREDGPEACADSDMSYWGED